MKKNLSVHFLLLIISVAITLAGRIVLHEQQAEQFSRIGRDAANQRSSEKERVWESFHYTQASEENFRREFLNRLNLSSLGLHDIETERLRSRVDEMIRYLTNPSFEEYYRLKTEGVHFEFAPSTNAQQVLAKAGLGSTEFSLNQPEALSRLVWNLTCPEQSGRSRGITAVCLDRVAVTICSSNGPSSLLFGKVRKGFTTAEEAVNPGFRYPDGSSYFHVSFFAKGPGSQKAGPVYVSLSWQPADQNWAFSRLISDQWVNLKAMF